MILHLEQVAGEREDDLLPLAVLDRELRVGREHGRQRAVDHALGLDLPLDAADELAVERGRAIAASDALEQRMMDVEADLGVAEGRVGDAIHGARDRAVGVARVARRPLEVDRTLSVAAREGDEEGVVVLLDLQVGEHAGHRAPALVAHGDVDALRQLASVQPQRRAGRARRALPSPPLHAARCAARPRSAGPSGSARAFSPSADASAHAASPGRVACRSRREAAAASASTSGKLATCSGSESRPSATT